MHLCKIGYIDCVHAKGLHGYSHYCSYCSYSTCLVNGQSMWVTPMSHSLEMCLLKTCYRIQVRSDTKDLHSTP